MPPPRSPVPDRLLREVRTLFGSRVAAEMGYRSHVVPSLGCELQVAFDGKDLWLRFDWLGAEQLSSSDQSDEDVRATVALFARNVADSLKEERGRTHAPLPWDEDHRR